MMATMYFLKDYDFLTQWADNRAVFVSSIPLLLLLLPLLLLSLLLLLLLQPLLLPLLLPLFLHLLQYS